MVKTTNGYEWLGEDDELTGEKDIIAREIMGEAYSVGYFPPKRIYDDTIKADKKYISSLPDLQNGPSSLIQGATVPIQQVGIHNFKLPLTYKKRNGKTNNATVNELKLGGLNIDSLYPSSIDEMRTYITEGDYDVFCINETKLDETVPDKFIDIDGYNIFGR